MLTKEELVSFEFSKFFLDFLLSFKILFSKELKEEIDTILEKDIVTWLYVKEEFASYDDDRKFIKFYNQDPDEFSFKIRKNGSEFRVRFYSSNPQKPQIFFNKSTSDHRVRFMNATIEELFSKTFILNVSHWLTFEKFAPDFELKLEKV